jgi:hypothetical protein
MNAPQKLQKVRPQTAQAKENQAFKCATILLNTIRAEKPKEKKEFILMFDI